jgi:hypothetical protein
MANSKNLAEALSEVSDLKKMAKSDMTARLLEHLQPRINQLVSKNLQEMGDEGYNDDEDLDENFLQNLMQEDDEEEAPEGDDMPDMGADDMEGEPTEDGGTIVDMTPEDLKQMIVDALKEITGGDAGEVDATDMGAEPEMEDDMDEDGMFEGMDTDDLDQMVQELCDTEDPKDDKSLQEQVKSLKKELIDVKKANTVYKTAIQENKLSIVKMSYVNRLIVESKLTDEQIIKFSEILDKTKSVNEVKNVYNAINESIKSKAPKSTVKTQKIKESYNLPTGSKNIATKTKSAVAYDPFLAKLRANIGLI